MLIESVPEPAMVLHRTRKETTPKANTKWLARLVDGSSEDWCPFEDVSNASNTPHPAKQSRETFHNLVHPHASSSSISHSIE
jgi:hypothetical protein